jgi:hypothetical protein
MPWVRYVILAAAFTAVTYSGDITIPLDGGSIVVENPQSDMAAESSCHDVQENVAKKDEEQPTGQVAADTAQDQRAKAAAKAARRKRLAAEQRRKQAEARTLSNTSPALKAQLGTPDARRIERHQDGAVVQVAGRTNQLSHFARTQNHRELLALLRVGQVLLHVSTFEHLDVQETKSADVHDHRIDGKLPVF